MRAFWSLASLALLLDSTAHAAIIVTHPTQSSSCQGGQLCEVDFVADGQNPLVPRIEPCDVDLYTDEFVPVQALPSVDISTVSSFTFVVDPDAGPDGEYYIVFTGDDVNCQGVSAAFPLTGMSGSVI